MDGKQLRGIDLAAGVEQCDLLLREAVPDRIHEITYLIGHGIGCLLQIEHQPFEGKVAAWL